ncbi:MAG: hypothetical protein FJ051_07770, partial [Cyanobacteria bacterium M_surface_9_m1_291]|nr:hypothetical protein [Cyanobacteria bacterium M_surface_9_m1_291]
TIRDGLQTRHIGPYESPKQAADDLDRLLALCGERARWQIHALESPQGFGCTRDDSRAAVLSVGSAGRFAA